MVNETIERFKNQKLLPKKTADGLNVSNPKTPKFYISLKIHKPNSPERPVINSIEYHTSEISRFVDHRLQPVIKQVPSYKKDTNHFSNRVNNFSVPIDSILVTMNVRSLYTNIPNNEGIAATKKRYDSYSHKTLPTKIITTFLALILTLNNFVFNSKFYLQIKGCAMGTICAPAYANIFMAEFEQKYIYPLTKDKSILFLRYVDEIFMAWTKSEKQPKDFMSEMNQKHPSIKFDYEFDCEPIEFLDTLVYIDEQNKLQATLFRKSSDRQNFLNAKSEHPYSFKKSIPYSQALRIRRICSTFEDYHSHSRKLIEQIFNKGYTKDVVIQQIRKVDQLNRKQLLHKQRRHDKQCIPLSVTYSRALPNLKNILTKHWHILEANQSCKKTFSTLPIIDFRKGTSLKQLIGTNTIHNNEKLIKTRNNHHIGKWVPCNAACCLCCQQLISKTTIKSNQTNKTFKICHRVNCEGSFVIYLLECYICNIQYVGKSETPFNVRLKNHRKDVKNPNAMPACKHFNKHDHDFNNHRKIIIIEQLRNISTTSTETLKERLKQ